jgi:fatty-acyl-CoA synthase
MHASLMDAAYDLLHTQPNSTLLVMLDADGETAFTTREFFQQASHYAHALQTAGIQSGDLVALVMQHGQEVLFSFWGALMLGAVPSIFPFLTEKLDPDHYFRNLKALVEHEEVHTLITYDTLYPTLKEHLQGIHTLKAILTHADITPSSAVSTLPALDIHPTDTAFLQHSSGSTGLQKGVMLSHGAVLNQLRAYSQAIQLKRDDVIVSWLPLYHDMGLIAGFILPIVCGVKLVMMSPFHWVRNPQMLLHAIHRHKGTLCWLPNFAYPFMASRIRDDDLAGLDLSSWRAAVNCSEPVHADSHEAFLQKFAPYGFSASALTTCYAMAENTFAVTQGGITAPLNVDAVQREALITTRRAIPALPHADDVQRFVSNGAPIPHTHIRIMDEDGQPLPERHVGEIYVQSDCMLTGYYARPDLSADALQDGWYKTGDMGYIAEGELYITGRKKDLIIVGGKNIYPQDIEALINNVEGIHAGRVVCFGIPNAELGTEDIAILAEVNDGIHPADRQQTAPILRAIRATIAQHTDVTARVVQLVEAQWLVKTSSGKIARAANREKFLRQG